eukprot:775339-Pleurochrysis_carterae.AAC.1
MGLQEEVKDVHLSEPRHPPWFSLQLTGNKLGEDFDAVHGEVYDLSRSARKLPPATKYQMQSMDAIGTAVQVYRNAVQ